MCFICDRPARAFLKCIKGPTGYFACERCTVKGYRQSNRLLYQVEDNVNRSDDSFRSQEQPEHHHSVSPLIRIQPSVNMINEFVLDFMHLGCLGVMKKFSNKKTRHATSFPTHAKPFKRCSKWIPANHSITWRNK